MNLFLKGALHLPCISAIFLYAYVDICKAGASHHHSFSLFMLPNDQNICDRPFSDNPGHYGTESVLVAAQ